MQASADNAELLAKAVRLEGKELFVKAAEVYRKIGLEEKAASALEKGGAFEEAALLFEKIGQPQSAVRCRKSAEEAKSSQTWSDLQADFVSDYPG